MKVNSCFRSPGGDGGGGSQVGGEARSSADRDVRDAKGGGNSDGGKGGAERGGNQGNQNAGGNAGNRGTGSRSGKNDSPNRAPADVTKPGNAPNNGGYNTPGVTNTGGSTSLGTPSNLGNPETDNLGNVHVDRPGLPPDARTPNDRFGTDNEKEPEKNPKEPIQESSKKPVASKKKKKPASTRDIDNRPR